MRQHLILYVFFVVLGLISTVTMAMPIRERNAQRGEIDWEAAKLSAPNAKAMTKLMGSLRVDSTRTAGVMMRIDPSLKEEIEKRLGDKVVQLYGEKGVALPILERCLNPEYRDPNPSTSNSTTGVIIDCRGLGMAPCLLPEIIAVDGEILLDVSAVNPVLAFNQGVASFSTRLDDAKNMSRVGKSPIVIKAVRIEGPFKNRVIISSGEALKLKILKIGSGILGQGKIAFVI